MRFTRVLLAAGLVAGSLSLAGCGDERPGHWGDRHGGRHHHDRGHHHDHGHDRDRDWH